MSRLPHLSLLALFACASLPALAEEPRYNQVSLRSEVSQEVSHDRMHVTLYTESQDSDPARLAQNVSETLNAAIRQATGLDLRRVPVRPQDIALAGEDARRR